MKNKILRINTNDKRVLSSVLSLNENYLFGLNWKLLFIEGTYIDNQTFLFEKFVNNLEYGHALSFNEVKAILDNVNDLWELLLIGQRDKNDAIRKSDDDENVFNSSDIVIEYFDSSYWTIANNNIDFLESVKCELEKDYTVSLFE